MVWNEEYQDNFVDGMPMSDYNEKNIKLYNMDKDTFQYKLDNNELKRKRTILQNKNE
jgi:hypothetical protein